MNPGDVMLWALAGLVVIACGATAVYTVVEIARRIRAGRPR